jgi:hypothetical protein
MSTSHSSPATHAGPWMADQPARGTAGTSGHERIVWRSEEELAMERAIKRSRIASIDFLNITIEISRQPRRNVRAEQRIERAARRAQLARQIARDREAVLTRYQMHS